MTDGSYEQRKILVSDTQDEELIGMDLLRACEAAALHVFHWIGKGDKEAADAAATDALRGMLNLTDMCGTCTIGEGIKDEAPGIFIGETLGTWRDGTPVVSIAVDPIDGTTLTSKGLAGALTVIAAAKSSSADQRTLAAIPSFYVDKIAVGPKVREGTGMVRLGATIEQNLEIIALKLGKRVRDLVVCLLDRPRHERLINDVRRTGAAIRLIGDGDVAAAIAPSLPDSGVDVYMGVGGSPEAVLAAAAIRCLGGEILCRMWPRDEEERKRLEAEGYGDMMKRSFVTSDMAVGEDIVFVASGITDNSLLHGVRINGHIAITHSVVMRAHSGTVRYVRAFHDLSRKTVHLASTSRHEHL
jgi:fructose-1,6-bisphosphatase II